MDISKLPPAEQLRQYKILEKLSIVAFPILSAFVIWDLQKLESGHSALIWAPVALLYEYLGYWPAVLFCPILGIICLLVFRKRIKNLETTS